MSLVTLKEILAGTRENYLERLISAAPRMRKESLWRA